MALFESGNPTLSEKFFNTAATRNADLQGTMSVRGTLNKFGFLLLMVIGAAVYNWHMYYEGNVNTATTLTFVGLFGGFVVALITTFKQIWAPYTSPLYALLEGLMLGGISAIVNAQFQDKYPGLILQAVGLTFGIAIAMFFCTILELSKQRKA